MCASLNSSYCYILQNGATVFTWLGSSTTTDEQELAERWLDILKVWSHLSYCILSVRKIIEDQKICDEFTWTILWLLPYLDLQPEAQSRFQKEGAESEQFWGLIGGRKSEYPKHKIARVAEGDPHLFSCTLTNGMASFLLFFFFLFHYLFTLWIQN